MTVKNEHLAVTMQSGDMPVLATPALVALMEWAARDSVAPFLPSGLTTVGGSMNIMHLRPSPLGCDIMAQATLEEIDGKRLTFSITASQSGVTIGEASHVRFVLDRERFMEKL